MTIDLDKQARELLAVEYERADYPETASYVRGKKIHMHEICNEIALRAIRVALSKSVDNESLEFFQAPQNINAMTLNLVARFASALAEKLAAAEQKYGYSDDWAQRGWMDECREHLRQHIEKGDPLDVAAYCAFLWHHGDRTALAEEQCLHAGEEWRECSRCNPSGRMPGDPVIDLEPNERRIEGEALHWRGIPVTVTGVVATHPGNWPLIDEAGKEKSDGK